MSELKELLVEELQDLLNAENQLVAALPKMAEAANNPILKQAFEKHLTQTEGHVERLKMSLELLGADQDSKPCKAMKGLIEEGQEVAADGEDRDEVTADLALIGAAQKVEHYEISGYGTARCLARHLGERKVAKLLSYTLGEEESADFILTDLSQPLLQQALSDQLGNGTKTPWGEPGDPRSADTSTGSSTATSTSGNKARTAAAGGMSAKRKA